MTRLGLSREEQNALAADERAMVAKTRPNAFDALRDNGRLGSGMNCFTLADVEALAARRWRAGDALRRLHALGWQNPCGGTPNPLSGHEAENARAWASKIEDAVGVASWPLVVRAVIVGDSLQQCRDLIPAGYSITGDLILLDRLCLALDRIGALLSEVATKDETHG